MAASKVEEFQCDICGVALANASELEEHREGHAEKAAEGDADAATGRALKCAVCNRAFDQPEAVKAHHRSAHGL
jgi:hypothetical protein